MKLKALDMALSTGSSGSHIGGAFSAMEILASLYACANIDVEDENRDRVIVSKGHCVLALYTALWQKGLIADDELLTFDKNGTAFHGHPRRNVSKGLEFSSGSLGLGLSYAVGVAMACKQHELQNTIYVLLGDGECDEGIVWEALMSIAHYKLNNMVLIVDRNGYQVDGPTRETLNIDSLEEKMKAFGLEVTTLNGHDVEALTEELSRKNLASSRVIIADTIKANGISFLVNNKMSHHCALTKKKYEQAVEEIKAEYHGME